MEQQHLGGAVRSWRTWARLGAIVAIGALVVAACGGDSGASDDSGGLTSSGTEDSDSAGTRTVEVEMRDNEFSPDQVEVSEGETVRFVFTNEGQATHDAVIGDEAAQGVHEADMRASQTEPEGGSMSTMGHGTEAEADEAAITVEPGQTGELMYTVESDDSVLIGCHEPGHYDAGMKLALDVMSS